jgi:hypothetical protein
MILRGPGSQYYKGSGNYTRRDNAAYEYLGQRGELMLPYYRYMTVWKDLYTVYGGTLDWAHDALGIMSFTNELWSNNQMYARRGGTLAAAERDAAALLQRPARHGRVVQGMDAVQPPGARRDRDRRLVEVVRPHDAAVHAAGARAPQRDVRAVPRGRDAAARVGRRRRRARCGQYLARAAEIRNTRAIPTRIEAAELYNSGVPDYFSITGARTQAGGFTIGELRDQIRLQEKNPARIEVASGVPGRSGVSVTWIVTGTGNVDLEYRSQKGGTLRRQVPLR